MTYHPIIKHLIIGYGQIGRAVEEVLRDNKYFDIRNYDIASSKQTFVQECDVLHICFPYTDTFVESVKEYIMLTNAKHVIIYSTVDIGTCKKIGKNVVHSPVEGVHPNLAKSIRLMLRWVGYNNDKEAEYFKELFHSLDIAVFSVPNTDYTEALKLLSTTEYGVNIVFAAYKKKIADTIGMKYSLMKKWNTDYNELYKMLGLDSKYQKYVLDAPEGKIGGHCVRENAEILKNKFPIEFIDMILDLQ